MFHQGLSISTPTVVAGMILWMAGSLKEGQKVIVEEGVAKLPDRTAFAGSVATADRLVRTMVQLAQVPLMEAVQMMTATPARIMKVDDRKGSIAVGKDADLVIFDDDINVHLTMVEGRIVYRRDDSGKYQS